MLIVGRAIAGSGAAGLFSGALVIVSNMVPLRQRPSKLQNFSTVLANS
jgi:predicted MFS family arabinose efflux permease